MDYFLENLEGIRYERSKERTRSSGKQGTKEKSSNKVTTLKTADLAKIVGNRVRSNNFKLSLRRNHGFEMSEEGSIRPVDLDHYLG